MRIEYSDAPCPHVLLHEFFSEEELKLVWQEIDLVRLSYQTFDGYDTGAATNSDGESLKQNSGSFLYDIYKDKKFSPIIKATEQNLFYNKWYESFDHWFGRLYAKMNHLSTLLNEYNDGDHYKPHQDNDIFTALIWLWKEPKSFSGGNFYFTNHDKKIIPENNSGIIFLGSEHHAVDTVHGDGRYCISTFINLRDKK